MKTFEQKLDVYYVATIAYLIVLIAYAVVTGTLIDERFEMVWRDPIVYLLALCALVSVVALIVAAVLAKKIVVGDRELVFRTRFKERVIRPEDIAWIAFRRGSRGKVRQGVADTAARIKLKNRRRRLWLRSSMFDESEKLMDALTEWAGRNDVPLRTRRRPRGLRGRNGRAAGRA